MWQNSTFSTSSVFNCPPLIFQHVAVLLLAAVLGFCAIYFLFLSVRYVWLLVDFWGRLIPLSGCDGFHWNGRLGNLFYLSGGNNPCITHKNEILCLTKSSQGTKYPTKKKSDNEIMWHRATRKGEKKPLQSRQMAYRYVPSLCVAVTEYGPKLCSMRDSLIKKQATISPFCILENVCSPGVVDKLSIKWIKGKT